MRHSPIYNNIIIVVSTKQLLVWDSINSMKSGKSNLDGTLQTFNIEILIIFVEIVDKLTSSMMTCGSSHLTIVLNSVIPLLTQQPLSQT